MSILFSRSLKQLQIEMGGRTLWPLLWITAVFTLWLLWFLFTPIPQFATSDRVTLKSDNQAIAYFWPSSQPHIHPGQPAQLQFEALQGGTVPATVDQVGNAVENGRFQVILQLPPNLQSSIPLQDGLTGSITIEVRKTSPASLLLQAVGYQSETQTANPLSKTE